MAGSRVSQTVLSVQSLQELAAQAAAEPSAACLGLCRTLDSLGIKHHRHVLVHNGFLLADVLLPQHGIALLGEGQGCYVRDTGKRRGTLSASCLSAAFAQAGC